MKILILAMLFGLLFSPVVTKASTDEIPLARCQQLAYDFAEDPDSLTEVRLKQLQFCINQTLTKRETTNPPMRLKGTIIDPILPSTGETSPAPPTPPNQD